jgi:regulator of sirC expression with transglutaminase-like and TPR domain
MTRRALTVALLLLLSSEHLRAINDWVGTRKGIRDMAIQVSVESDPKVKRREIRGLLNRLALEAERTVGEAQTEPEKRRRFNSFFFEQLGFSGESDQTTTEGLLLHRVLDRRRGNCVGLAQAYLSLAEELGLPVVAAATPTHLFARWIENGGYVNVELLERGAEVSDDAYRQRQRIRETDPAHPVYLRNLNPQEVMARVHNNLGVIRSRAGLLGEAVGHYARALQMDPLFPAPRYNRGLDHLNAGRPNEALLDFDSALAIYPAEPLALNNRGLALLRLNRYQEAVEAFGGAVSIDPDLQAARSNLEIAQAVRKRDAGGLAAAEAGAEIGKEETSPSGPIP